MAITKTQKKEIINNFSNKPTDTGSSNVQVAILTERIKYISEHLKSNPKDKSTSRGLYLLISKRKKLLSYLEKTNLSEYKNLIQKLGLRK